MTNEDFKKMAESLNQSQAIVMGAKIIADALDRITEVQKENMKIQMKMSGVATDMFKKMSEGLDDMNDVDSWKHD